MTPPRGDRIPPGTGPELNCSGSPTTTCLRQTCALGNRLWRVNVRGQASAELPFLIDSSTTLPLRLGSGLKALFARNDIENWLLIIDNLQFII